MSARTWQWNYAFGAVKQAAYGTVQADAAMTKSALVMGPPKIDRKPVVIPDSSQFGMGDEWSRNQALERWDIGIPFEADFTTLLGGYVSAYGLGADTVTNPGAGAAFLHTCKPIDPATTLQQPSATIVTVPVNHTGIKKKIQDLIVPEFKISGTKPDRLKLNWTMRGSGIWANSTATMPALTAAKFLRMKDGKLELGNSGAGLTDISSRFHAFELGFNNGNDGDVDGYFPGSTLDTTTLAQFRGRHEIGEKREIAFIFTFLHGVDGTESWDRLDLGTNTQVRLTFTGEVIAAAEKHKLTIDLVTGRYKVVEEDYINGRLAWKIQWEPHYDVTSTTPLTVAVENDQATHL